MFYILIVKLYNANIELFFVFPKKYELFYINCMLGGN